MPRPRGGARRDLRRSLLAAVGRAWLTRGAVLYLPDGVKAADHTHFQRDIRPCGLIEIRDDPRADAPPPSPPTRVRVPPTPLRPHPALAERTGARTEAQGTWRAGSAVWGVRLCWCGVPGGAHKTDVHVRTCSVHTRAPQTFTR